MTAWSFVFKSSDQRIKRALQRGPERYQNGAGWLVSVLLDVFVEVDPDEHPKDTQNVDFNIES